LIHPLKKERKKKKNNFFIIPHFLHPFPFSKKEKGKESKTLFRKGEEEEGIEMKKVIC